MQVKDIMTHDPSCSTPEETLSGAAKRMKECDCGAIPVVDNQASRRPEGIITDRDIVIRALAEEKDPRKTKVDECMTKSLVTVTPEDDVRECVRLMEENQIRRILVVNDQGAVAGIVVQAQIARNLKNSTSGDVLRDISRRNRR